MQKKWLLALLVLPFLGACGTSSVNRIQPVVRAATVGEIKKIVILPFADYTPEESPYGYWQRNLLITEALQDEMLRFGYVPAVHEDVIAYLSKKNIIQDQNSKSTGEISGASSLLKAELEKDWSDRMKVELMRALQTNKTAQNRNQGSEKYWDSQKLIAVDHNAIRDIGATFDADYVVRGRVVVFKTGQADSFNPLQTGVLPFFFKAGTRTVFGMAQTDSYEMIDKMAIGGLLGAAVATPNWPAKSDGFTLQGGSPRFGGTLVEDSTYGLNRAIWGVAGAGLAHLAHNGGRVDSASVQIRMVIQETQTGKIVWTNRAEVEVTPKSAYGEHEESRLIAQAIQEASASLVDNFIASETGKKIVSVNPDGTLSVSPAEPTEDAGNIAFGDSSAPAAVKRFVDSHTSMMNEQGNSDAAQRSLELLEQMSRNHGAGEITLFFPLGVANLEPAERERLVRFADSLSRGAHGRKILFVSIGSASSIGDYMLNLNLAQKRSEVSKGILDKYLTNIPHEFHKIYGTGELYSPKNISLKEHQRYQHVRIIAVFDSSQLPQNMNPPVRGL
ncbi:MAG: hypothetical protein WC256_03880 [Desulfurivibrionaceae bacterium]